MIYVSPLKALSADIRRNLQIPLAGIAARAEADGAALPAVRAELRTGDTPAGERARMTRKPPHILVTTPESLYLLLTATRGREMLATADTVIVDEIHALARDKRGSHLALSLERLDRLAGRPLQRIGLSATVRPLPEVARFLSPRTPDGPAVVPVGHRREMDIAVEVPDSELGAVATHEIMEDIRDRIAALIEAHDTTLVFVNTRRMAERLTHVLGERLPEDAVLAHHGSLAREVRLEAERRLQEGDVRAIVATASLELGIDIGSVDLVCQLGSPRSIAVALQRVGRSGHWLGAVPKGRFFPTTRDELVECAALLAAVEAGDLDRIRIPEAPLDILAQQLVAEAGATPEERHDLDELFGFVRRAYPYRDLEREAFDAVVGVLSDGVATARGRRGAFCTGTPCRAPCAPAGTPAWRRSRTAARSPKRRSTRWSPNPTTGWWASSTRTSPSRAPRATCSCWAPPRGGSGGSPRDRSGSKTRRGRPPPSPSGGARPRDAPRN